MALPVSQGGIDYPDGGFSSGAGSFPMIGDLAELAARMGSINTYDRRGTVIWMTDFRHGLQGSTPGVSDAGCDYHISTERSHFGGYSLELDPSDESGSYIEWGNVVQFLATGKMGLEAIVSLADSPDAVRLKMYHQDGTTIQEAELNYDTESGDWTVRTGDTTWETVLTGFEVQTGATAWYSIKLVIDPETGKYERLQVAKEEVDISEHSIYSYGSGNLGQLICRVMVYGDAARHAAIWVDAVIVTQNE